MQDSSSLSQYKIDSVIIENQRFCAYHCLSKDQLPRTVNRIKDKSLIKYYLRHIHTLSAILPVDTYFVAENDLFIVIKSEAHLVPIDSEALSEHDRAHALDQLLAKFAQVEGVPYFVMTILVQMENLCVSTNGRLVFQGILNRQNPEQYDTLSYLQRQIGSLVEATLLERPGLEAFIKQCEESRFGSLKDLFVAYHNLLEMSETYDEPVLYQKMYTAYTWLTTHKGKLIGALILVLCISFGYAYFFGDDHAPQPYQKLQIGMISYADPYTEENAPNRVYQINALQDVLPAETEAEVPVVEMPTYEVYVVSPGDYLYKIALSYYGDSRYAIPLATYNQLEDPNIIPVGFPLKLPTVDQLDITP